jgi:cell division protein FtsI/penicillin-binding protein 2
MEPAMRGTIRDRFFEVLAANAIDYRVGIVWAPIREIPRFSKEKKPLRKEYVKALSRLIEKEVGISAKHVEDLVYSYAVFSSTTPIVVKRDLSEKEYYRLSMLARNWPGLVVERGAKRIYPKGRSCCHIVGYTASVNREEYSKLLSETKVLRDYVERVERGEDVDPPLGFSSFFAAKEYLLTLDRKAYNVYDDVGKMGVEASCEKMLRGMHGKRYFITNAHGDFLREASGSRDATSGKRVVLCLSAELQDWCERLLAQSEKDRYERLRSDQAKIDQGSKNPFVRGGAIVVMDPKNAEVLACASYPRFDPNDFVRGSAFSERRVRWLEGDDYVRRLFDREWPIIREEINEKNELVEREEWLTWDTFLNSVLPLHSPLLSLLHSGATLRDLLMVQESIRKVSVFWNVEAYDALERLAKGDPLSEELNPYGNFLQNVLQRVGSVQNLCVYIDLSKLIIRSDEVPASLYSVLSKMSIETYLRMTTAKFQFSSCVRKSLKSVFEKGPFIAWREEHESSFLRQKRKEEEMAKISARPFLYYLEKEMERQYSAWWDSSGDALIRDVLVEKNTDIVSWVVDEIDRQRKLFASSLRKEQREGFLLLSMLVKKIPADIGLKFLSSMKGYRELTFPLVGKYTSSVRNGVPRDGLGLVRSLLSLQSPPMTSFGYMQTTAQGSVFKLVVASAALRQQLERVGGDETKLTPNFFQLTEQTFSHGGKVFIGVDSSKKPIPQIYKGGRIPRSLEKHIGDVDLIRAIEKSSNPYFSLLAGDYLDSPRRLIDEAVSLGYGQKTGILLPNEASGRVPSDLESNKTGVYTTAIGQHTLLSTPLQTAVLLSAIATGGEVMVPRIVKMAIGPEVVLQKDRGTGSASHQKLMERVGIDFPIWVKNAADTSKNQIRVTTKRVKRKIIMAKKQQQILFEGMKAAASKLAHDGRLKKYTRPDVWQMFHSMQGQMMGKSSTAESYERLGLCIGQKPFMYNHTWFGGLFSLEEKKSPLHIFEFPDPELVVVVFLRYGTYGKEAAPIAAAVAKRWQKIKRQHEQS